MKGKSAFTLIELMVVIVIIAIVVGAIGGCAGGCSVSDGTRKGTLTKCSYKGIIMKTYEAEMVMGGFRQGANGSGANVWDFSVRRDNPNRDEIVKALNGALEQDQNVTVKYKQSLWVMPWNASTTYDILEVRVHSNGVETAKQPVLEAK